jgi:hypothetical protein
MLDDLSTAIGLSRTDRMPYTTMVGTRFEGLSLLSRSSGDFGAYNGLAKGLRLDNRIGRKESRLGQRRNERICIWE